MKIDIGSFGYNFKNEVGENPSWGTSVGQSEMLGHKITRQGKESLALGFLYRAIDVSKVETESSKGGGRNEENPIVAAALFDKVFVNGKRIEDCEYIITLKKQIGDTYVGQHFGRLTLKYAPTIAYDGKTYNEDIFDKINSAMGWSPDWTWFASDISVISQDELHFRIHCFGKKVVFVDANDKRAQTEALMASDGVVFLEEDSPIYQVDKVEPKSSNEEYADVLRDLEIRCGSKWEAVRLFGAIYYEHVDSARFKEIRDIVGYNQSSDAEFDKGRKIGPFVVAKDLLAPLDEGEQVKLEPKQEETDIKQLILEKYAARTDFNWEDEKSKYDKFQSLYGKEVIKALSGKELLYRLFARKDLNPDSLKYAIEFSKEYVGFGRARVGENHHYFLYLPPKSEKWIKGQNYKTEEEITEDEAIEYAGVLRDKLVALFDRIEELAPFDSVEKYKTLESEFYSDSFYTKQWIFKYMHMLYPQYFTCWYSWGWLEKAIALVGFKPEGSAWVRNGQISLLANELEIANVFVYRILIEILQTKESVVEEIEEADDEAEESALPIRTARTYRQYPLNLILYGAPGTGKTYSIIQLAASIVNKKTDSIDAICEGKVAVDRAELVKEYTSLVEKGLITFTTFHQSYGYEDFIQGLRPDDKSETLRFVPIDGVFKRIADKAIRDQENNYVIIIDEINRANMSKVLGELITLLETDKRWGEINQLSTKLPSGQTFAVPNNLYVIGTMNSADKSISLIDAALRRRFEFVEVSVNYDTISDATAKKVLKKINEKLESQLDSTDLLVGHAYFIGKDENTLCDVMNHNVIPLLYEYFFDSKAKVKDVLKYALTDLPYTINDEAGRRIKVSKN